MCVCARTRLCVRVCVRVLVCVRCVKKFIVKKSVFYSRFSD